MDILFRYLHFLGILALSSTLFAELLLAKPSLPRSEIRRLSLIDAGFGVSAMIVLVGGLMQWFQGAKPAAFYTGNPVFLAKVACFGIAALLSIYPTVFFLKHRKGPEGPVSIPASLRLCLRIETALVAVIPLLAVLMARGVGLRP